MSQTRIEYFDIVKAIAISWVVFHHTILFTIATTGSEAIAFPLYTKIMVFLTPLALPAFFAISGYLSQNALNQSWSVFIKKRIWPLFYLFVVWSVIRWFMYTYAMENVRHPNEGENPIQLVTFVFAPKGPLWFLWALIIALLLIRVIHPLPKLFKYILTGFLICLSCLTFADIIQFENFAYTGSLWYAVFTFLGAYASQNLPNMLQSKAALITSISVPVFIGLSFVDRSLSGLIYGIEHFILCTLAIIVVCTVSALLTKLPIISAVLTYIGQSSLHIYVTHSFFITIGTVLTFKAYESGMPYVVFWSVPLVTIISLCIPLLIRVASEHLKMNWLFKAPSLHAGQ